MVSAKPNVSIYIIFHSDKFCWLSVMYIYVFLSLIFCFVSDTFEGVEDIESVKAQLDTLRDIRGRYIFFLVWKFGLSKKAVSKLSTLISFFLILYILSVSRKKQIGLRERPLSTKIPILFCWDHWRRFWRNLNTSHLLFYIRNTVQHIYRGCKWEVLECEKAARFSGGFQICQPGLWFQRETCRRWLEGMVMLAVLGLLQDLVSVRSVLELLSYYV